MADPNDWPLPPSNLDTTNVFAHSASNGTITFYFQSIRFDMVKNIYGKTVTELDKMRVEEKIEHIKQSIPSDLYEIFKVEWANYNKSCVDRGKRDRRLEEFDYYFELFMKFPH